VIGYYLQQTAKEKMKERRVGRRARRALADRGWQVTESAERKTERFSVAQESWQAYRERAQNHSQSVSIMHEN